MEVWKIISKLTGLFMLVALIATACGAPAQPAAPTGNQAPVIQSLTAMQNQTFPGSLVEIKSSVTDTENDLLTYKWTCSGGNFRETGNSATWVAAAQNGTYVITLEVSDGKGGSSQQSVSILVGSNHAPQISSLTASPTNVQLEGVSTLTCVASDADGDAVTYSWKASEGTINGQGAIVSWAAPRKQGSFIVTVTAKDNKDAESKQDVTINVSSASNVIMLKLIEKESGTTDSTGDKNTMVFKAGDDEKGIGYRAFFNFNIMEIQGMEIRQARLKLNGTQVTGDPFNAVSGLGAFQLRHFTWKDKIPAFTVTEGGPFQRAETQFNKPLIDVDVTPEMVNAIQSKDQDRFGVEACFFNKTTNGNGKAEFVTWTDATLEVEAAPK